MPINYGTNDVSTSGTITSVSGVFSNLTIGNSSFDVAVSGLLPTISDPGNTRLLTSDGSDTGIIAQSELTYSNNVLRIIANESIPSFRINQFYDNDIEPSRLIFRRAGGSEDFPTIAASGDGVFAIRAESLTYDLNPNILGGIRMEIVEPASSTSLHPSTRIFLRNSEGGNSFGITNRPPYKDIFFESDGTLRNPGQIRAGNFYQQDIEDNIFNGSLAVEDGLSAPTKIHNLGTVSGDVSISYDIDKQIQTLTLNGTATNFIEGSNWPISTSVDVLLEITVSSTTTVSWTIVDDQYNPFPTFNPGKYLVLLRSIGTTIQGHYIGEKTN